MEKGSYECSRVQVEAETDHDNAKYEEYKIEYEEEDTNGIKTSESKWNCRQTCQYSDSRHTNLQVFSLN